MSKKPYDAHQTLKPGEPHFTLQGGDPLAPKAISYYADLIRKDALKRDTKRGCRSSAGGMCWLAS